MDHRIETRNELHYTNVKRKPTKSSLDQRHNIMWHQQTRFSGYARWAICASCFARVSAAVIHAMWHDPTSWDQHPATVYRRSKKTRRAVKTLTCFCRNMHSTISADNKPQLSKCKGRLNFPKWRSPCAGITGDLREGAIGEMRLQTFRKNATPVLLYGLEICPPTDAELHSLDFAVTRFLMKLFKTSSIAVI